MEQDARQLPDGHVVTTDLCIIGAGPAGLTLAQSLTDCGHRVALLESGGAASDGRTQALSGGELSGDVYEPLDETHLRQVGGTANHWIIRMSDQQFGYRYAPLTPIDFEARDELPNSGWPISREDLDPYYARANEVCRIGPFRYRADDWSSPGAEPLPLDDQRVQTHCFLFGPTSVFTREFPDRCRASGNVTLYTHATVTELTSDPEGRRVVAAQVDTFEGKRIEFRARHFVIAAGGLQTPRLLLASRSRFAEGLGNRHDVVGRYFMDHSLVPSGNFYPDDPRLLDRLHLYDMRLVEGTSVLAGLSLADPLMREHGLHNLSATLFPMPELKDVAAIEALKGLMIDLKARRWPEQAARKLWSAARGGRHLAEMMYHKIVHKAPLMPGFGQGGWSRLKNNHKRYRRLELLAFVEQAPLPENRVTLTDETDALGMPKIRLHYRWPETDLDRLQKAQRFMVETLASAGLGRYEPATPGGRPAIGSLGLHHLMGTTRMHDDPRRGVVDRHCQVHGVENLYIASSSIFTTGGYANPTLTILALALRLSDFLQERLDDG